MDTRYTKRLVGTVVALMLSGCATEVAVPKHVSLQHGTNATFQIRHYTNTIPYQDINAKKVTMPRAGEQNAFGVKVTPELQSAYENYLDGDGYKALEALDKAIHQTNDPLTLWQISFLKAKTYLLLGLESDAELEVKRCSQYEQKAFGHTLNSTALQGEIYLMEGDFKQARNNFNAILLAIGGWELPTSYSMPPSNVAELVSMTTAQIRAYTGMAASYVMQDRYKEALIWAQEAEARFNAVFYVANHPLYGMFLPTHLDSYYGRAINMAMLASAILGGSQDYKQAEHYYEEAFKFFDSIGYKKGKIITLALKAQTLVALQRYDDANSVAKEAIALASERKLYDFIWRIEALRGKIFLRQGKTSEAEHSLRAAVKVVDLVSGELQTDLSKRRFGVGKEDIVYELMKIDMAKNDLEQLFVDVENGRARAFVDMMRQRALAQDTDPLLAKIKKIDKQIKRLTIEASVQNSQTNMQQQTALHSKRARLVAQLKKRNAQLASVVATLHYSLEDIQSHMSDDTTMLYFLPVKKDEKISALLITNNSVKLHTFPLTQAKLSQIMDAYLTQIGALTNSLSVQTRSFQKRTKPTAKTASTQNSPLATLHKTLSIESITTKKVLVVGSGATSYIPWGTYDGKRELSLIPNGAWVVSGAKPSHYQGVVIVGNPDYGGELEQLSGTVKEVQALAKLYGTKPLLFRNATIENLRAQTKNGVKVLHLATHGVFYSDKPLESAIFLSHDRKLYTLTAKELFRSPIKAKLVVLSACETGMGKNVAGDDLLGLPRSFFLGGTQAIVSSLWPIDDEGTKEFMVEFHKWAKQGEYQKGLLLAKEHLRSKGYPASVYGAFVLYGGVSE